MNRKIAALCAILCLFVFLLKIQSSVIASDTVKTSSSQQSPIYLVFLMDSSGSMKGTDPDEIRKLASQVVVTLMSPEDRVAVVEFDSDARVLSDWKSASERDAIFAAIDRVGRSGKFTDFRDGLESAKKLFSGTPSQARKIVLLLSDGVLEPNLSSDRYPPYYIQYRLAIRGKSKAEIAGTNEEFRNKLTPVAKRIIDSDILPFLNSQGIEIYAVGLGPDADKGFLNYLADKTSMAKTESHYFYANQAVDLMDTFTGLLHFWEDKMKVYSEGGEINPNVQKMIIFDEFLREMSFIVLSETNADFSVTATKQNESGIPIKGTHPKLKILGLTNPTGEWTYRFNNGSGRYTLLVVGKSTVDMDVVGLKEKYALGEQLNVVVYLKYNGRDARSMLANTSRIEAEIMPSRSQNGGDHLKESLKEGKEGFLLSYPLRDTGSTRIKFTLYSYDKQGKEMLPRPSKEYRIEVLPRFYVEPDHIDFGNMKTGKEKEQNVKVTSGLSQEIKVQVKSMIKNASRCQDSLDKLPFAKQTDFSIGSGQGLEKKIVLVIPEKGCWGDFEGEIQFSANNGESSRINFRVHVPSIWERIRLIFLFLFLLLFCAFVYLIYIWGYLGTPSGILIPTQYPPGESLLSNYYLSQARQGLFSRWFNWKRNRIYVRKRRPGVSLSQLPGDFAIELRFYRFGGAYIGNSSVKDSGYIVKVDEPIGGSYQLSPGQSLRLNHESSVEFEGYKFTYEQ